MIIAIDTDNLLYLFNSQEEVEIELEAIDIENEEYEFCDEKGQRYQTKTISLVSAFKTGSFTLEPTGKPDKSNIISLIKRAKSLDRQIKDIKNIEQLLKFIEKN